MGAQKYDPKAARDLFVVQGLSLRQIASQMGVSASAMAQRSRKEDWPGQKIAYSSAIARRSYENMAEGVASERGAIISENVLAARSTIRKYLQSLADGKINPSAKDALEMMKFLVDATQAQDGLDHAETKIVSQEPADKEFLQKMIERARERVAPEASIGSKGLRLN